MLCLVEKAMVVKLARFLLVVCVYTSLVQEGSEGEDILELGSSLIPTSKQLISSSSAFLLSFRPPSASTSSTNLFLCISFAVAPAGPPAWVANRDTPVSSFATLKLLSTGDLTLSDTSISATPIWSSKTPNLGVVRAQLLDSGNLVLLNNESGIVWQSFLNPTDTLLPNQNFTLESTSLKSNQRTGYFVTGSYVLSFSSASVLQLSSSAQPSYWSDWGEISSFWFDLVESNITLYSSPSSIISTFVPSRNGSSSIYRLTLDVDGNLRIYAWDAASAEWKSLWMAFTDVCRRVNNLCGDYGVCVYNPQPTCECPQGFSVKDSGLLSDGCKRNTPIQLDCSTPTRYVEIENVDYPFHDYQNFTEMSIEQCKERCLSYCPCVAAVFYQSGSYGHCWLKTTAQNGYNPGSQQHLVFLKIAESDPSVASPIEDKAANWSSQVLYQPATANQTNTIFVNNTTNQTTSSHTGYKASTVIALAIVIGVQAVCFIGSITALIRSRKKLRYTRLHGNLENVSGPLLICSYQEIEAVTENFSHKLGAGGFGTVYKGKLQNGKLVAVKELEGISHQEKQFRAEIATIGCIHHINLVRLEGFCSEGSHRLLVYEFMENGSLDQILFPDGDRSSQIAFLNWNTRFQICLGVARGLHYLHEECLNYILHCDIKPQNILLDSTYTAKVADFGLAYLYSRDHTVKMTTIRGTRGYLAPEWVSNLPITAKADVYSYGMLVMEILSGRKNYMYTESAMMDTDEKWCFPMWAYGKKAEEVIDARVDAASMDWKQADSVLRVAFACIQADVSARPSMGRVVQMLEGNLLIPETQAPLLFSHDHPHRYLVSSSSKAPSSSSKAAKTTSSSLSTNAERNQDSESIKSPHSLQIGGPGAAGY